MVNGPADTGHMTGDGRGDPVPVLGRALVIGAQRHGPPVGGEPAATTGGVAAGEVSEEDETRLPPRAGVRGPRGRTGESAAAGGSSDRRCVARWSRLAKTWTPPRPAETTDRSVIKWIFDSYLPRSPGFGPVRFPFSGPHVHRVDRAARPVQFPAGAECVEDRRSDPTTFRSNSRPTAELSAAPVPPCPGRCRAGRGALSYSQSVRAFDARACRRCPRGIVHSRFGLVRADGPRGRC